MYKVWAQWVTKPFFTLSSCVFIVLDEPRQSKVGNLADAFMGNQNVGRPQVPMDVIFRLDEGHAISHLQGTARRQTVRVWCVRV